MFPVGSRSRNRGRGFAFNRGAKIPPSFVFDFLRGSLDSRITYTGSNGTYFNSSGTLTAATTNVPRLDYNPATLVARGLLIEEARTNSIRNNTMVGAAAGTPGTLPTNWSFVQNGGTGLSSAVTSTSSESGISALTIQVSGTPSAIGSFQISFEPVSVVAASTGQIWTASSFIRLIGGSYTNIGVSRLVIAEYTAAAAFIQNNNTTISSATSSGLNTQRQAATVTLSGGVTTAFIIPSLVFTVTAGSAIDITLRIGMPQLELGAFATSVISTSSAAVTRAADIASITGASFSSFWNATQGTIVAGFMNEASVTASTFPNVFRAGDGTANNFIAVTQISTNNRTYAAGRVGGVSQWDIDSSSATYNTTSLTAYKAAIAYQANNIGYSLSGTAAGMDTSATIPTVDRLEIGSANSSGFLNGWISSLAYYQTRLPDSELRSLSA